MDFLAFTTMIAWKAVKSDKMGRFLLLKKSEQLK